MASLSSYLRSTSLLVAVRRLPSTVLSCCTCQQPWRPLWATQAFLTPSSSACRTSWQVRFHSITDGDCRSRLPLYTWCRDWVPPGQSQGAALDQWESRLAAGPAERPAEPAVAIKVIVLLRGFIHQSNVGPTTAISGGLQREEKRRRKSRKRRRRRRRRKNLRTPGDEH